MEDSRQGGSALDLGLCFPWEHSRPQRASRIANSRSHKGEEKARGRKAHLDQSPNLSAASWPVSVPPASAAIISHARDCAIILRSVRGGVG